MQILSSITSKVKGIKINKNKAKFFAPLVPIFFMWLAFWLGHSLNVHPNVWWGMPYMLTSMFLFIASIIWAAATIDKDYYDR